MPAITIIPSAPMKLVAVPGYNPDTTAVEWPRERAQDPATGFWTTTRRLEGTEKALIALADKLIGVKRISHREGDFFTLTVEVQGSLSATGAAPSPNSLITTQWSLEPTRLQKPLWLYHPVKLALEDSITDPETRSRFRADFEALVSGSVVFNKVPAATGTGEAKSVANYPLTLGNLFKVYGVPATKDRSGASPQDVFRALLSSRGKGTDSFVVASVVLSKVDTAPPDATNAPPDFLNVNFLYSTNALLRTQPKMTPIIRAAILRDQDMRAGFWFKEMPSMQTLDSTHVQVRTMWNFTDLYDEFVFADKVIN